MQIAILTFERFNEIDSFVAASILNRLRPQGVEAHIVCPSTGVTSMNGIKVEAQRPLRFACEADAVVIGSGKGTHDVLENAELLSALKLDPTRQLIASQCSGSLILHKLGLLPDSMPACCDVMTRPMLQAAGAKVTDRAFHAEGNVATAGGCLASQYVAFWLLTRGVNQEAAEQALRYVAPVGEEDEVVARAKRATRSMPSREMVSGESRSVSSSR